MADNLRLTTLDRLTKQSSTTLGVATAASTPQCQAIADSLNALIKGADVKAVRSVPTVIDAGVATPPADEEANRLNKWLIRIQDDTNGRIFPHEIGTADNTLLGSPTTDFLDLTASVGLAFKNAVEAAYESPYGNSGVVLTIQQVNRSGKQ